MKKRELTIVGLLFFTGGLLGWLIDTSYRSITTEAFSHADILKR